MSNDHKLTGTAARIAEDNERHDAKVSALLKMAMGRCDFCDTEAPLNALYIRSMEGHLRCKDRLSEPDPKGFKIPPFGKTVR